MMGWGHDMLDWCGPGFGGIAMVLFWVLLIVGVAALARGILAHGGRSPAPPERPLDILQRRYAKGEIDRKEYEEKKRDLLG